MQDGQHFNHRLGTRRRVAVAAGASAAVAALVLAVSAVANAATLFSDDFNDGNANGWSTSGGRWSVSSGAYVQSGAAASAKAIAGATSWSTATVSTTVVTSAFGGSTSHGVGIAARVQSSSNFYALVLTPNAIQIRKGASATLASAPFSTSQGTDTGCR